MDVSLGTLYRHARPPDAENRPKRMDPDTLTAFVDVMGPLGLLDGYDLATLRAASDRLTEMARAAEGAESAHAKVSRAKGEKSGSAG